MGARKLDSKFPIQEMAIRAITIDHDLQSRVATSMEYQREFSETLLREERPQDRIKVFPPVTVFFDGKVNWLADGFHRIGAFKAAGMVSIRAEVRDGSRRDAIVFSAGANQKFSIPRTREDIRKAIWMLLEDPVWFKTAERSIASHVGASAVMVKRHRVDYCHAKNVSVPDVLNKSDGRTITRKGKSTVPHIQKVTHKRTRQTYYRTTYQGKNIRLGDTLETAQHRADELVKIRYSPPPKLTHPQLLRFFSNSGVAVSSPDFNIGSTVRIPGIIGSGWVATWTAFDGPDALSSAVGSVMMIRQARNPSARMIVMCDRHFGTASAIVLAEALDIEFMTPKEVVAEFGPKSEDATPTDPA